MGRKTCRAAEMSGRLSVRNAGARCRLRLFAAQGAQRPLRRGNAWQHGDRSQRRGGAGSPAPRTDTQTDTMAHFGTAEREEKVDAPHAAEHGLPRGGRPEAAADERRREPGLDLLWLTMPDEGR